MADQSRSLRAPRVLLTLTCLEFFGPILRDFNATHAFHPAWVGHARLHLVWLLGFMLLSGIVNLYLIWFRRPADVGNLWLSAAWQGCNLGGFWIAALLAPVYGGLVRVPDEHIALLGINENVLAFLLLSLTLGAAVVWLRRAGEASHAR